MILLVNWIMKKKERQSLTGAKSLSIFVDHLTLDDDLLMMMIASIIIFKSEDVNCRDANRLSLA